MSSPVHYEEFIPTDRWSLQDYYLMKMIRLERLYSQNMRAHLGRSVDRRALLEFYGEVLGYYSLARYNMERHLSEGEMGELLGLVLVARPEAVTIEGAMRIMSLLGVFHWKSGLSKLTDSKPIAPFAYARSRRGIDDGGV